MSTLTLISTSQFASPELAKKITEFVQAKSTVGNKVKIPTVVLNADGNKYEFLRTVGIPNDALIEFVTEELGLPKEAILKIAQPVEEQTLEDYMAIIKKGFPKYLEALVKGKAICLQMDEREFIRFYPLFAPKDKELI